jgi:hypothetical protein
MNEQKSSFSLRKKSVFMELDRDSHQQVSQNNTAKTGTDSVKLPYITVIRGERKDVEFQRSGLIIKLDIMK